MNSDELRLRFKSYEKRTEYDEHFAYNRETGMDEVVGLTHRGTIHTLIPRRPHHYVNGQQVCIEGIGEGYYLQGQIIIHETITP